MTEQSQDRPRRSDRVLKAAVVVRVTTHKAATKAVASRWAYPVNEFAVVAGGVALAGGHLDRVHLLEIALFAAAPLLLRALRYVVGVDGGEGE